MLLLLLLVLIIVVIKPENLPNKMRQKRTKGKRAKYQRKHQNKKPEKTNVNIEVFETGTISFMLVEKR